MSWAEIKRALNTDADYALDEIVEARFKNIVGSFNHAYPLTREALINRAASITYSVDTTLTSRIIVGDVITINSGITVTTMTGGVVFVCNQFVNNGTLTAAGKGAPGGAEVSASNGSVAGLPGTNGSQINSVYIAGAGAAGGGGVTTAAAGSGGTSKTAGTAGTTTASTDATDETAIDLMANAHIVNNLMYIISQGLYLGAGGGSGAAYAGSGYVSYGGAGGAGGGGILIICEIFNNAGTISAAGADGANGSGVHRGGGGGGGGGGLILIDCITLTATGTLNIAGGAGGLKRQTTGTAYDGSAGGDGLKFVVERMAA